MENDVDEANRVNNSSCLRENDIPRASLGDGNQSSLKIPELKGWERFNERKKAELVLR